MSVTDEESRGRGDAEVAKWVLLNPALHTLLVMAVVSLATWTGIQANNTDPFILQPPAFEPWWQLPLSIYAHGSRAHLWSNVVVVAIAGGLVSVSASAWRFHLFFVGSGITAGLAQLWVTDVLGAASPNLGSSGAAFALVGYLILSNPLSSAISRRVPRAVVVLAIATIALGLALQSAGPNIANIAHLTGAVIGLVAGQLNLLQPRG